MDAGARPLRGNVFSAAGHRQRSGGAGGSLGRDKGSDYIQFTFDFEDRIFIFERLDLEAS